jgi:hypothetical protein
VSTSSCQEPTLSKTHGRKTGSASAGPPEGSRKFPFLPAVETEAATTPPHLGQEFALARSSRNGSGSDSGSDDGGVPPYRRLRGGKTRKISRNYVVIPTTRCNEVVSRCVVASPARSHHTPGSHGKGGRYNVPAQLVRVRVPHPRLLSSQTSRDGRSGRRSSGMSLGSSPLQHPCSS